MNEIVGITGATGFVGGAVLERLRQRHYKVRLLIRDATKLKELNILPGPDLEVIVGDLTNVESLKKFCTGLKTVIHCAAVISASRKKDYDKTNVIGTHNVVQAVKENHVERFVYLSSLAATRPDVCAYGRTKRKSESYVKTLEGVCDYVILRPPAVYGPADKATFELFKTVYKRGMLIIPSTRSSKNALIFVTDLADAIINLIEAPSAIKGIFEIDDGNENGYLWDDIREIYKDITQKPIKLFFLGKYCVYPLAYIMDLLALLFHKKAYLSYDKAQLFFCGDWLCKANRLEKYSDWKPRIKAKEGFRLTLDWYIKNGWL